VGAVHEIHDYHAGCTQAEAERIFMRDVEVLLSHPISVLAHPFRWFRRKHLAVPKRQFKEVASRLAGRSVAAEINFHTNTPDAAFYEECLACGAPISFGSDTHEMEEAGECFPHLRLMRSLGCDDDAIRKVLYRPS
jgi:histidinol phosphatase-like PHP family hydrolase